jgi:hypothetical protein
MTLSGTSHRYAVWDDMAIREQLSWVQCDPKHPLATTIGQLRIAGWSIPPLPVIDQVGEIHDASVTVVASTAVGPDDGRELVDRETFDAKLAEFEDQRTKLLVQATETARKQDEATAAAVNAVRNPDVKAALQAMLGNINGKGKS